MATLLVLGLISIAVYLSGDPAEHAIVHQAGVSRHQIHEHEDVAKLAFYGLEVLGLLGLLSLLLHRGPDVRRGFVSMALLLTVIVGGVLAVAAHRGGLIRHPELRPDFAKTSPLPEPDRD
jgi:hypothetical protein